VGPAVDSTDSTSNLTYSIIPNLPHIFEPHPVCTRYPHLCIRYSTVKGRFSQFSFHPIWDANENNNTSSKLSYDQNPNNITIYRIPPKENTGVCESLYRFLPGIHSIRKKMSKMPMPPTHTPHPSKRSKLQLTAPRSYLPALLVS